MKKLIGGTAVFVGLGVLVIAATALATPSSGMSTSTLSLGRFGAIDVETAHVKLTTKGDSDVYVVSNTFEPGGYSGRFTVAPGGQSGWHTHPGPSLITVKRGTVTNYNGDDPTCTPHVYHAGTGFIDPGGGHAHLLRNEGTLEAETIVVQILPAGAARRTDAPNPGNCNF